MENRQMEAVGRRLDRARFPVAAFLAGVLLGGLLAVFLFMLLPSRSPVGARWQDVPGERPVRSAGETEPASTLWHEPLGSIGEPVGIVSREYSLPLQPRPAVPVSGWRFSGGPCSLLVAGGLLGGCLLGAGAMAWGNRQATARLEARVRRFEHMTARHRQQEDWLAELDQNLEGEWDQER